MTGSPSAAIPQEAMNAARDAARPYAADIAEEIATHLADVPAGCDLGSIIGAGLARAVIDALQAAAPLLFAAEQARLRHRIEQDAIARYEDFSSVHAGDIAEAVAAERQRIASVAEHWTEVEHGHANSSGEFKALVIEVEQMIRSQAHTLVAGRADVAAQFVVAQLAHKHYMVPVNLLSQGEAS